MTRVTGPVVVLATGDGRAAADLVVAATDGSRLDAASLPDLARLLRSTALTGRSTVVSAGSAPRIADLDMLLTAADDNDVSVGFVYGWAGPDAAAAHVRTAFTPPGSLPACSLVVDDLVDGVATYADVVRAAPDAAPALLDHPYRLLALGGHGFGIDNEAPGGVLCGLAEPGATAGLDAATSLPCGTGGPCKRAVRDGKTVTQPPLLPPSGITADVLFLDVCNGLLTASSPFPPRTGVLTAVAASSRVRAVLTTFTAARPVPLLAEYVYARLRDGARFGDVARSIRTVIRPASAFRSPYILLGDPRAGWEPTGTTPGALPVEAYTADTAADLLLATPGTCGCRVHRLPGTREQVVLRECVTRHPARPLAASDESTKTAVEILSALLAGASGIEVTLTMLRRLRRDARDAPERARLDAITVAFEDCLTTYAPLRGGDPVADLGGNAGLIRDVVTAWLGSWRAAAGALLEYAHWFNGAVTVMRTDTAYDYRVCHLERPDGRACPVCAEPLSAAAFEIAAGARSRRTTRCGQCHVVADLPDFVDEARLVAEVTPDRGAIVARVELTLAEPRDRLTLVDGVLGYEVVPWVLPGTVRASVAAAGLPAGHRRGAVALELPVPDDLPPGRYGVVAVLLLDAEVVLARTWVVVPPRQLSAS